MRLRIPPVDGVVVALVVQVLLTMLGLGIGIATLDPGTGDINKKREGEPKVSNRT